MKGVTRYIFIWVAIGAGVFLVFKQLNTSVVVNEVSYTKFVEEIADGSVSQVKFSGDGSMVTGTRVDGSRFSVVRPAYVRDDDLMRDLLRNRVDVEGEQPDQQSFWLRLLISSFPILLMIGLLLLFMRYGQGGSGRGNPLNFGRSKARMLEGGKVTTTFDDVAGCDEAKEDVAEIVDFLRDQSQFERLGGRVPCGILMVGAPGTGKTLLARAIAGEAGVPFFTISGSDFVEMFVGVGASRVRDLFDQGRQHAPCILFIDEIDAVGRHRGAGVGGGHDEREQTLNQLLVEMDGFEDHEGVIVIAATNRPDVLDPALLRPGRFDRQVVVNLPDIKGRSAILKVHLRKIPVATEVDIDVLARGTPGFSGADLENLVNEAALMAAREREEAIGMRWFEEAKDKLLMGAERRSLVMSEKEKRITAYHESGHAIVGRLMPDHDPVHKVTIIPRGLALGLTMFLPEEDKYSQTRQMIVSQIVSLFGGRVAEEMIYGADGITTGAANDIKRATEMARNMVTRWGLSDELGPLEYEEDDSQIFLGRSVSMRPRSYSAETAEKIDREVRRIIDECYERARTVLSENQDKLHLMAESLMEHETLDSDQIGDVMAGAKPRAPSAEAPKQSPKPPVEDAADEGTSDVSDYKPSENVPG